MNEFQIQLNNLIYDIYDEPYLEYMIDGEFINELLDKEYSGNEIKGLVPPYSGWLIDAKEDKFANNIFHNFDEKDKIIPLLICPDDQDLTCTTIVTKIKVDNDIIIWNGIGFEMSYNYLNFTDFGKKIKWLDLNKQYEFDRIQYTNEIQKFNENKKSV